MQRTLVFSSPHSQIIKIVLHCFVVSPDLNIGTVAPGLQIRVLASVGTAVRPAEPLGFAQGGDGVRLVQGPVRDVRHVSLSCLCRL